MNQCKIIYISVKGQIASSSVPVNQSIFFIFIILFFVVVVVLDAYEHIDCKSNARD